jgi:cobalt/nickel transport protein
MRHGYAHWLLGIGLSAALFTQLVDAHFHMLLPSADSGKRGWGVLIQLQWGHPFEHQLFDASRPERLYVVAPDGTKIDLLPSLEKDPDVKTNDAYRVTFVPQQRGDYVVVMRCAPVWMEEDKEFLHDTVKVVVHVQAQSGWDRKTAEQFEICPLTRPYGLEVGTVMVAQALIEGKPLADCLVEIEQHHGRPPPALPAEEFITRTAKTDPNGLVTTTLRDSGWWCITAQRLAGNQERGGKSYPVRQRATLWVFVQGTANKAK